MKRVAHIALREFTATALTKGFIIGGIIVPIVLVAVMAIGMPLLMKDRAPRVTGSIAFLDGTGTLGEELTRRFTPEALSAAGKQRVEQAVQSASDLAGGPPGVGSTIASAANTDIPTDLTIELLAADADIEAEKQPLTEGKGSQDGGRLALVIIDPDSVEPAAGSETYGSFQIFVRPKLDDRVGGLVRDQVRSTIREARIRNAGFSPERLTALTSVDPRPTREVTVTGERGSLGELNVLFQFAFMFLLMMAVFIGGQYLLTTTIEEKSSRVIELLLAAASPMNLMAGKIFGQMGVGMFLIIVYGAIGWTGLLVAARADLVSPMMIVWFFCYFFISYTIIASLMAAIGSAVNDLREAQSLMTPVMMIVMIPYLLWLPIARDPNSTFSTITSFVPGISPFVMVIRLTSTEPPPLWQVFATILLGLLTAYAAVWFAAKIFRVGLLMFGKPPDLKTLLRWVRMA
ncbi:MAG: ABC transporter permease [Phycisphaeraceae bacterium]|nr:ABC transporter permease [Phycisphaeraceae bacterium]MCW5763499.1 ABC transporter permease [Phycisphaeraceae bacterium]